MITSLPSLKLTVLFHLPVLTWSLLGVKKKLVPRPDRSPSGVSFKMSGDHPCPFYKRVPPPGSHQESEELLPDASCYGHQEELRLFRPCAPMQNLTTLIRIGTVRIL